MQRPYDSKLWRDLRGVIYDRDGGMCRGCPEPHPVPRNRFDVDHIIPWKPRGSSEPGGAWFDPSNLRLSCRLANRGRPGREAARHNAEPRAEIVYLGPSREW